MPRVELIGVRKSFPGGVVGLGPTDLVVEAGETLALLGPSGSGKSTLLRLVAGLDDPDAGEIRIDGVRVDRLPPHRRGVAMVPQRPALYPHLSVADNLAIGGLVPADILELLGLGPLLGRFPHQLSGGERQRVVLAKLAARDAAVWLLDEPFTGLDPVFRPEFRHDLHLLRDRGGGTILLVTHDPADAFALGHRIGVLGGGLLQQLGTPEALRNHPETRFVAAAIGRSSLIAGTISGVGAKAGDGGLSRKFVWECGAFSVPVPDGVLTLDPGGGTAPSLTLGIRPEDIFSVPPGEIPNPPRDSVVLTGWPVVSAEPDGSGWLVTLARGRTRLRAWRPSGPPRVGTPADWVIPIARCSWFDGPTGRRIAVPDPAGSPRQS